VPVSTEVATRHGLVGAFRYESLHRRAQRWSWRQGLCAALVSVPDPLWRADDVVVVAGELVANAIEHAGGPLRLLVTGDARSVEVRVDDAVPDLRRARVPRSSVGDPRHPRGRGLDIVAALTQRWGWHGTAQGKTVWAIVAAPAVVTGAPDSPISNAL